MEASDDNLKRLCMPSLFSDRSVMWVYDPEPPTSSWFWWFWPQRIRVFSRRDVPGVMYASVPMIGLMPFAVACFQNSYAPNMLP